MKIRDFLKSEYAIYALGALVLAAGFAFSRSSSQSSTLGAVPSSAGLPGIYNATTTDLTLRDGYGSALAVDSAGRVILSPSSTGIGGGSADLSAVDMNIVPDTNNAYNIGTSAKSFKNIYASGTAYLASGNIASLTVRGNIVPGTNNTRNIGAFGTAFASIYSSSTIHGTNITAANVTSTNSLVSSGTFYTGSWTSATDPGSPYPFMRFPLSATPAAGTRNNAIISMGTQYMLGFYGENTGAADAVQNRSVNVYAPRFKVGQANTTNYIYVGTTDGCGALKFTTSSTYPTFTPTSTSFCL